MRFVQNHPRCCVCPQTAWRTGSLHVISSFVSSGPIREGVEPETALHPSNWRARVGRSKRLIPVSSIHPLPCALCPPVSLVALSWCLALSPRSPPHNAMPCASSLTPSRLIYRITCLPASFSFLSPLPATRFPILSRSLLLVVILVRLLVPTENTFLDQNLQQ